MKESSRKVLMRLKRNFIERESELISQGMKSTTPMVVIATLNELRKLKDPFHMHEAVELLNHPVDEVVIAALRYLERVEHPIAYNKLDALIERSAKVKKAVANAVKLCDYKSACELLRELLRDPSLDVKLAALKAYADTGCDDAMEYIQELSKGNDVDLKLAALETLIELGEEVEEGELKKMIFNPSLVDKDRKKALKIFLKYSISPLETVKKVIELNHLPLTSVALESLGKMKCASVWEIIEEVLSNENLPAKIVPILNAALKTCANEKAELEKLALRHIEHPSKKVKILSFKILMRMDVPQASDLVNEFLNSSNADIRSVAVPFVYNYPSQENVESLNEILHSADEKTIAAALKTVRRLKIRSEDIEKYIGKNYSLTVRKEALKTLISLALIDSNELESIALSDEPLQFKMIALDGLAKIDPAKLTELEVA
jgi:HEAT repeat protein